MFSESSLVKVDYHYQNGKLVNADAVYNYKAVYSTISKYLEGKLLSTHLADWTVKKVVLPYVTVYLDVSTQIFGTVNTHGFESDDKI